MYEGMGYQWASFLAGMLALMLAATPFVLIKYGPSIRAKVNLPFLYSSKASADDGSCFTE